MLLHLQAMGVRQIAESSLGRQSGGTNDISINGAEGQNAAATEAAGPEPEIVALLFVYS
jgi:hypothetical protein